MRPKVVQRPWQRRACQFSFYGLWPLLLLWAIFSYPTGTSNVAQQPAGVVVGKGRHNAAVSYGGSSSGSGAATGQHRVATELSDTNDDDWLLPKKKDGGSSSSITGGTAAGASSSSSTHHKQQQEQQVGTIGAGVHGKHGGGSGGNGAATGGDGRVYSSATVYAVRNGNGNFAKFYYKFKNVRLTRKALYFYMPPGMSKPQEHWVDFISGNATHPGLPTMIVIKGEVQRQKWFYLPVRYTTAPSQCSSWTTKPTYFLQVRYSYNIWHTWDEGLMGVFQTLREQGLLPLVQVDTEGNMREVTEGLSPECPTVWDVGLNNTRAEEECVQRLDVVRETKCDKKNQAWCRPGVVSYHRFDGPIILPYTAASVMNRWAQVYDAMTTDVRDFSLVDGHCFTGLIVGKTNTLNFYQAANFSSPITEHIRERIDAMAVFKAFVKTAQREFVAAEKQKNPQAVEFRGYANPKMERLRRGIGPEHISLVEHIAPSEVPGLLREELPQLKELWSKRRKEIAKIEAAWKAGKKVVSLPDADDDAAAAADGGGGAEARRRRGRRLSLQQQAAAEEGGSEATPYASSDNGDGSLVASTGEGARRRAPDRSMRGLLQEEAGEDAGSAAGGATAMPEPDYQGQGGEEGEEGDGQEVEEAEGVTKEQVAAVQQAAISGSSVAATAGSADEAAEAEAEAAAREAVLKAMPAIVKRSDQFTLEQPRPVVTYMSRNFFSRGVLNEHDVLRYILAKYNVTLRVTTFEEPLLEAMELLQHTDVLIGMHGAGWTNGMFIKHSAVTLQMYPYGWRLPDNSTIRGYNYREIVLASECPYLEWVSPRWDYAFFRRIDFNRRVKMEYVLHPDPNGPHPVDGWPGNPWIYQNTYVDMAHFGPYIDQAMARAGIPPMPNPIPVTLN